MFVVRFRSVTGQIFQCDAGGVGDERIGIFECGEQRRDGVARAARGERERAREAQLALRRLDAAAPFHPASADLWIERANIQLTRLRDVAAAAVSYRRAWEQPNAPYYAARLHAEMLKRLGRKPEALAWLIQLHPQLPPDDESACADLVLARIRELERELRVPAAEAYRPHSRQPAAKARPG